MSKRSSITVSYDNFDSSKLVLADEPYALEKGGKLASIRYQECGKLFDILRIQTPELTIGNVWDNIDDKTGQLSSYTIALNLDCLHPQDMENGIEDIPEGCEDELLIRRYQQSVFVETLESIDNVTIEKASTRGWFKEKGKPLERTGVQAKFSNTVHWPSDAKYTLGIRVKINVKDVTFENRKVFICDEQERDVSYYKIDQQTNERVYIHDERFNTVNSDTPIFNIDSLKTRGARILRSVIESNNAWIQNGLSCSWKLMNVQVETVEDTSYGQNAWLNSTTNSKRKRDE